jgi:cobalt-precorrin-5B (C1)-methyltransferase
MEVKMVPEGIPTTGLLAAAAAKGAFFALAGIKCEEVDVILPSGRPFALPLSGSRGGRQWGETTISQEAKESGPLKGIVIIVRVTCFDAPSGSGAVIIEGGQGVGVVTVPALPVPIGSKAINPVPLEMIRKGIGEALFGSMGEPRYRNKTFLVSISVPNGETVARRTLNPSWGIVGGISILGTRGVMVPHWQGHQETIRAAIQRSKNLGLKEVIFQRGLAFHSRSEGTILVGRHLAFSLQTASEMGIKAILKTKNSEKG